ncbi:unnamed protein product [Pedinophyceae sp. YPF-701]|nr:unnamed protein product [Pedinophyceae sp. YPF-701]
MQTSTLFQRSTGGSLSRQESAVAPLRARGSKNSGHDLPPQFVQEVCDRLNLHETAETLASTRLQTLWAGYGSIYRLAPREASPGVSAVVKDVRPPPMSSGCTLSHARKLKSYRVEARFYREVAPALAAARRTCTTPQALVVVAEDDSSGNFRLLLALTDLSGKFAPSGGMLGADEARAALEWLAAFHAHGWGQAHTAVDMGLWEEGCYWHLETRPEELAAISPTGPHARLGRAAHVLDARMRGMRDPDGSEWAGLQGVRAARTLVHGDFKGENILIGDSEGGQAGIRCAAYDFQYCGGGLGTKDVAYLLGSSVDGLLLKNGGDMKLLQHYHKCLTKLLPRKAAAAYTFDTCKLHYALCVADYARFLAGWGWWGNSAYLQEHAEAALDQLGL